MLLLRCLPSVLVPLLHHELCTTGKRDGSGLLRLARGEVFLRDVVVGCVGLDEIWRLVGVRLLGTVVVGFGLGFQVGVFFADCVEKINFVVGQWLSSIMLLGSIYEVRRRLDFGAAL